MWQPPRQHEGKMRLEGQAEARWPWPQTPCSSAWIQLHLQWEAAGGFSVGSGSRVGVIGAIFALESVLWPFWVATWTVVNKEESYSLKHGPSAKKSHASSSSLFSYLNPRFSFSCVRGVWGVGCIFLHWGPSRVDRNPEEHRCGC